MLKIFQSQKQLNSVIKTLRQYMKYNKIKSIGLKTSGVKINYDNSACKYITYDEFDKLINER